MIIEFPRERVRETDRIKVARILNQLASGILTGDVPAVVVSWYDLDGTEKHRCFGSMRDLFMLSSVAQTAIGTSYLGMPTMPLEGEE